MWTDRCCVGTCSFLASPACLHSYKHTTRDAQATLLRYYMYASSCVPSCSAHAPWTAVKVTATNTLAQVKRWLLQLSNCVIPFSPPPPYAADESSLLPPHARYVPFSRPSGPTTSPWWPPSAWSSRRRAKRGEALAAEATGVGGALLSRFAAQSSSFFFFQITFWLRPCCVGASWKPGSTVTKETPPCSPTTMRSTTTCTKVSHGSVGVRHAVLRRERGRVGTIRISYGCPMYPHPPNRLKVGGVCLILEPAGTTPSHLAAQHCPPLATCFRC